MRGARAWAIILLVAVVALPAYTFGIRPRLWDAFLQTSYGTEPSFFWLSWISSFLLIAAEMVLRMLIALAAVMVFARTSRWGRAGAGATLAVLFLGDLATGCIYRAAQLASRVSSPDDNRWGDFYEAISPILGVVTAICLLIGAILAVVGAFASSAPRGARPEATGARRTGSPIIAAALAVAVVAAGVAAFAQPPLVDGYLDVGASVARFTLTLLAEIVYALATLVALWATLRALVRGGWTVGAVFVLVALLTLPVTGSVLATVGGLFMNATDGPVPAAVGALLWLGLFAVVGAVGVVMIRFRPAAAPAIAPQQGSDAATPPASGPLSPGSSSPVIPPRS